MGTAAATPLSVEDAVAPQLHRRLRDRIVSCDLAPGQRISETEIAETYGVSRQPVREAFIKLAEERLVSIRPQRGTYIQRISVPDALTARFIREAVEVELVRLVVERVTPDMLAALDEQIAGQRVAAREDGPAAFVQLDETFHRTLARFAGEPAVSDYLDGLNVQMNRVRNITARQFSTSKLVDQHAAIVKGIRAGDAAAAEAAMRQHLRQFNEDLPQIIAAYPDYFEGTEAVS